MRSLAFAIALLAATSCQASLLLYSTEPASVPPTPPEYGQWAQVSLDGAIYNAGVSATKIGGGASDHKTAYSGDWYQSTETDVTEIGYGWLTGHNLGPYLSASTPLVLDPTGELRPRPSNPAKFQERWLYNGAEVWADVFSIPEPSTAVLLLVGLVGLRRRD